MILDKEGIQITLCDHCGEPIEAFHHVDELQICDNCIDHYENLQEEKIDEHEISY